MHAALAVLGTAFLAAHASAALIDDAFNDGVRTNGADANDTAWYYSTSGTGTANLTVSNNAGLANAIGNTSLGSNQMFVAALPDAVSFSNNGDYLQVTYTFSRTTNANFHSNVRVGFFDIATVPSSDNFGAANFNAALGYTGELPAEGQSGRRTRLREDTDTASNRLTDNQGSSTTQLLEQASSAIYVPNNTTSAPFNTIDVTFRLTKVATGTELFIGTSQSAATYSVVDTAAPYTTFNSIGFGWGNSGSYFFDNILVTTNVPEPTTVGVAALACSALGRRRRR